MNEVDLMPCPFCGGEAKIATHDWGNSVKDYWVYCRCGCELKKFMSKEDAINDWNTRKPMDEGIEKLKEEMVFYEQIKKETEEKDYRYLYHKIAEAYGKAVVIMHKSKWQEKGEEDA